MQLLVISESHDLHVLDSEEEGSPLSLSSPSPPMSTSKSIPENAILLPGQIVSIRIGDISQSRKAWKKRRRSGSPILVPCTILGMDRKLMVKWNVMALLHTFGKKPLAGEDVGDMLPNKHGVVLSVGALVKLYKHRLGGNLLEHAQMMGHDTIVSFLQSEFNDEVTMEEYGIKIMRAGSKKQLILASTLTHHIARESISKAAFVQFQSSHKENSDKNDNDIINEKDRMIHTGTIQIPPTTTQTAGKGADLEKSIPKLEPLSAAVRISQEDADSDRIYTGLECNSFVMSYDACGDNGSPLITCAIDPPRGQIRDQMKRRSYVRRQIQRSGGDDGTNSDLFQDVRTDLGNLKVGDGPFQARVVRVSSRAGASFVDLGVGRQRGKKHGGGTARVLGMLRFEDAVHKEITNDDMDIIEDFMNEKHHFDDGDEDKALTVDDLFMNNNGETIEDVTDLFELDQDGNLSSLDAATGEKTILGSTSDAEIQDDDEDDLFAGMSAHERLEAIGSMLEEKEHSSIESKKINQSGFDKKKQRHVDPTSMKPGDEFNVYIRSVYRQSGRLMVTLDPAVKGRKAKDLKKEKHAEKRLSKLISKMGGEEVVGKMMSKKGSEMEGVVKAISKSGDWYYVQPNVDEDNEIHFPVGVANMLEGTEVSKTLSPGDRVLIRLDGIDESRGQLAFTLLE